MSEEFKKISYRQLFYFFLPLAVMPAIIGISHTAVNATLARLPFPELTLAVFAVAKSISNIIKSPIHMSRQVITSLVKSVEGYYLATKFILLLSGTYFFILSLLGYTPLGGFLLSKVIGLTEPKQIAFGYVALRIMCFIPFLEALRNIYQGIAISLKKTQLLTPGVLLRIVAILLFLWWITYSKAVSGVVAGSLVWVVGIGIETLFIGGALIYYYGSLEGAIEEIVIQDDEKLTLSKIIKFFIPIGLMSFLIQFVQPVIQSGIAHSHTATNSLAAYGVAWTLVMVLVGALDMLHQCSLVYSYHLDNYNWNKIRNFCVGSGAVVSSLIFITAISPIGYWVLNTLISISEPVTEIARQVMIAFSLFPVIRAFKEAYWGVLMQQQNTSIIGIAKTINLVVVAISFWLLVSIIDIEVAVLGAIAISIGEGVESIVIWYYAFSKGILEEKDYILC
ncbi:Na+-driven multidrug efflux pump [Orenia metallireducens]|jgi:hypothetical protein|uniref:Na+-driven multidrug efflux pump n=1 Tax=Orenia metallireducens TaxID=1413210 RepID=A0A285G7U7_9FIRM|nr:hypothetical protein [Orenia metallireducens]PRX24178.1 Na+-driven multidrug efflux pump [Orenia metallireducens]SNY19595.1 Na+-driven multidrug efflux pump [Orenia metallireducens]